MSSSSSSPFRPFATRYHHDHHFHEHYHHDQHHHCYYYSTTANNHHNSPTTTILTLGRTRGPPSYYPVGGSSLAIRQVSTSGGGGGSPPPPKKKPSRPHRHRQQPQKKPQKNLQEPMVTTTISSLQDHWESTKKALLHQLLADTATTTITPSTIHLFQETLKYSIQQEDFKSCWELLTAAAKNATAAQNKKEKVAIIQIPSLLFSSILQLWQTKVKTKTNTTTHSTTAGQQPPPSPLPKLSPRQIAQWIDDAQRLGILERHSTNRTNRNHTNDDPKQYWAAILLNVASYLASTTTTTTTTTTQEDDDHLTFSVEYLQEWIDEAIHSNSSSSLPDQVVVGTVLQGLVAVANQQQSSAVLQSLGKKDNHRRRRQHQQPQDHHPNEAIRRVESFWTNVIEGQLLQRISSSSQTESPPPMQQPSMFWFHSMISMYAKQGHVEQVQDWMTQMQENYHLQPDLVTWNSLLQAYAKRAAMLHQQQQSLSQASSSQSTTSPAQQAQRVLDHMKDLYYHQQKLDQPPDVVSYSTVLDAWAQQAHKNNPQAAIQAEQLLDRMRRAAASATDDDDEATTGMARPNIISYNTVIQAHGRAGNVSAAERLFSELIHETHGKDHTTSTSTGDSSSRRIVTLKGEESSSSSSTLPKPNDVTISIMLSVWLQVGIWEAAERSEKVLRQVLPLLGYAPDVVLYGICLACWAKVLTSAPQQRHQTSKGQGPRDLHKAVLKRAETLWDEMVQKQRIQPDVVAYTNMMNIYGNSNQPEKAEALLQEMIQHQQSPNVHTLSVLLSAWTRSSHRDGVSKAQACLARMETEFGVQPNVVSYTTLLQAWSRRAKQGDTDAPDKALELLRKIGSMANARSYAAVIQALAQQGRAQEAQDLLEEMLPKEQDEGKGASTRVPPPDVYAFSAVLHAWSKTRQVSPEEAAQRAEQLVLRMHDLYERRVIKEGPNVVCFSNVLKCWSQVEGPSSTTNQQWNGAERAQAILERMEGYGVKPNLFSINIVLNAWANQARVGHPEAIDRATALLDYARSSVPETPPDEYTYRALFKAISSSPSHIVPDKYTRAWKLVDEMKQQSLRVNVSYLQRLEEIRLEQEQAQ